MEGIKEALGEQTVSRRQVLQMGAGLATALLSGGALLEACTANMSPSTASTKNVDQPMQSVVIQWNTLCVQAIRRLHAGPPEAARILAIMHTCMYDAWTAYDPVAVGTHFPTKQLRRPAAERTLAHKKQAISYAAYRALVDLFPSQVTTFATLMRQLGYNPQDRSTNTTQPTGIGNSAAQAVLMFFFSSRRRHTRSDRDWSSDVCSSDLAYGPDPGGVDGGPDPLAREARLR